MLCFADRETEGFSLPMVNPVKEDAPCFKVVFHLVKGGNSTVTLPAT